jgi:hypothetical protein
MIAYHGSNRELRELDAGSWITDDPDAALDFAMEKVAEMGGVPVVMVMEVDDGDVEWDVISMAAGIEDERGILLRSLPATLFPQPASYG